MDKSTRIRLIQQVRDALSAMGWEDIDLLLAEFGFGTFPSMADDISLTDWLRQGNDDELVALGRHLAVPVAEDAADGVADTTTSATTGEPGRLFLFRFAPLDPTGVRRAGGGRAPGVRHHALRGSRQHPHRRRVGAGDRRRPEALRRGGGVRAPRPARQLLLHARSRLAARAGDPDRATDVRRGAEGVAWEPPGHQRTSQSLTTWPQRSWSTSQAGPSCSPNSRPHLSARHEGFGRVPRDRRGVGQVAVVRRLDTSAERDAVGGRRGTGSGVPGWLRRLRRRNYRGVIADFLDKQAAAVPLAAPKRATPQVQGQWRRHARPHGSRVERAGTPLRRASAIFGRASVGHPP